MLELGTMSASRRGLTWLLTEDSQYGTIRASHRLRTIASLQETNYNGCIGHFSLYSRKIKFSQTVESVLDTKQNKIDIFTTVRYTQVYIESMFACQLNDPAIAYDQLADHDAFRSIVKLGIAQNIPDISITTISTHFESDRILSNPANWQWQWPWQSYCWTR